MVVGRDIWEKSLQMLEGLRIGSISDKRPSSFCVDFQVVDCKIFSFFVFKYRCNSSTGCEHLRPSTPVN